MNQLIKNLYKENRCLLGEGYDNALEYIKQLIELEVIELPSGLQLGTWEIPEEWVVKDAWVKYKGKKIIDYKKNPLSLLVGSLPFKGEVTREELKKHLWTEGTRPKAFPYAFQYYEKNWGVCLPQEKVSKMVKDKAKDVLKKGMYEVFIDTEYRKGKLKLGVHTIKGKSDREVLLFAHLDHPFQANDNLSGVACLVDLAKKIKSDRTIKIIFCPETIGSIAYAFTQDISKVDYVIAVDAIGNDNSLLVQKALDKEADINFAVHMAVTGLGINYRKGEFRFLIGSDEYVFNDPKIGIPGIMLSRYPYPEYHTEDDTPKIVKEDKIKEVQKVIQKTIEIMDKDYIPVINFSGPLMRSKYKAQTQNPQFNREIDYFIYNINGETNLIKIAAFSGIGFDYCYDLLEKLMKDGHVVRIDNSKKS